MSYQKLSTARKGVKNFTGSKIIKAPLGQIAQSLFNPDTLKHWLAGLSHVEVLSQNGSTPWQAVPQEFEFYQTYKLQSPISNRDYVIAGRWDIEGDDHAILFIQSIERDDYPIKSDFVRGALNLQIYRLKQLPDAQGTEVEVEINVDPSGNFPVFVVNLYGSTWCAKTLSLLEKTVHSAVPPKSD